MQNEFASRRRTHRQRGAVLVISLVLLLIVTLLGVSGMGNTQMELRMSANTAANGALRQGAHSLVAFVVDSDDLLAPADHVDWQIELRGTDAGDSLPPGSGCAAGQWRMRKLGQSSADGIRLDGHLLEAANFELEVECYELGDRNADGTLDAADGPRVRIVTGVTVRNQARLAEGTQ